MWRLALRTLSFRKDLFTAVFTAMFLCAVILSAAGTLTETGLRKIVPPQRLAGAAVVVTGDPSYALPEAGPRDEDVEWVRLTERVRLDAVLLDVVRAVPGAAGVVGDLSFPATVLRGERPSGTGHDWSSAALTPYELDVGVPPAGPGEVVLDAALAGRSGTRPGDRVEVAVGGVTETYQVTGVAAPATGRAVTEAAMFFSAADARRLTGHPRSVDAIAVVPAPGVDAGELRQRIRAALRGHPALVLTGDDRGIAEFPQGRDGGDNLLLISGVTGGITLLVALLVVAGTLRLSVEHRMREMTLLRAMGTPPGRIRRMVLGEAVTVSALAVLPGCLLGPHLGRWLFDRLVADGVVPGVMPLQQSWIPVPVAAAACMLAAAAAAYLPARRASRAPNVMEPGGAVLRDRPPGPVRPAIVLVCLGGGAALTLSAALAPRPPAVSVVCLTVLALAVGLTLIASRITGAMTELLRRPVRALFGQTGHLAILNARARTVRMAAAITPIMLVTGIALSNVYLQTTQADVAERAYIKNLRADAVLTAETGGLAPALLGRVRSLPGVAGASEFVTGTAFLEHPHDAWQSEDGWPVQGISGEDAGHVTAFTLTSGTLTGLRGNTVALAEGHARQLGRGLGDVVRMRLGDGHAVDLRLVALFSARPGAETILMPAGLLAAHTTAGLPPQILVRAASAADVPGVTAALARSVAAVPGLRVTDGGVLTAVHTDQQRTRAWVNYLFIGTTVVFVVISVVTTQAAGAARRCREFRLQRLIGSSRGQILRMVGIEGVLVAVIGVGLGTVFFMPALLPFTIATNGSPLPSGPVWIYVIAVCAAALSALMGALSPTWLIIRPRPAAAGPADG
ncbi:putative ABC transport system permease protein [Streptosporangium becharense]|uniref:Putative ABC transport system permease protein n=1 Tax=Streptosporangium becharense TaxID=1816182 RepID=A0A7W9IDA7_9ACTN|nr:FtsX-like permease family protein [Streptosporangium becharense]MBB2915619.1 putative ABC transport system permease protein [Streptosporangium becharense]MBB5818109.1 putative ABC transport system permease protein [Streptosporangium becharense]